ncbi:hypothetical protein EsH8_VIII_000114 [Colletotrichum jinshuiense]
MRLAQILLGLAATVFAVDMRFFLDYNCAGSFLLCANLNPNVCCATSQSRIFHSVRFTAIPTNSNIECRAYASENCFGRGDPIKSNGRTDVCLPSGNYSSGNFGIAFAKREEIATDGSGEECQKANLLVLEDGTKYNIATLDEDLLTGM